MVLTYAFKYTLTVVSLTVVSLNLPSADPAVFKISTPTQSIRHTHRIACSLSSLQNFDPTLSANNPAGLLSFCQLLAIDYFFPTPGLCTQVHSNSW